MQNRFKEVINLLVDNKSNTRTILCRVLTNEECAGKYRNIVGRDKYYDDTNYCVAAIALSDKSSQTTGTEDDNINTIYPWVNLMAGVDDGFLLVPEENSNIMVSVSDWNDPFVVQFSAVKDYGFSSTSADGKNKFVSKWTPKGIKSLQRGYDAAGNPTTATQTSQFETDYSVVIKNFNTGQINSIYVDDLGFETSVNDNTLFIQTKDTFTLRNEQKNVSLRGLFRDLVILMGAAQAPPGAGGGPLLTVAPVILSDGTVLPPGPLSGMVTPLMTTITKLLSD